MIYFIIIVWTLLSIIVVFFALLDDKRRGEVPKWLNYSALVLFFWLLLPLYAMGYLYDKYDKIEEKKNV